MKWKLLRELTAVAEVFITARFCVYTRAAVVTTV